MYETHSPKEVCHLDFLHSLYDIVSGLGSFLLIPVFFFLMGLVTHAGFQRSGQCALAMLGSTVAIQLLINTLSGRLTTLVSAMVDNYSLSTGAQNLPWQTAAEMTLNSDILYWVLPGAVLLNLLMLATRVTRVLNMDLWSLWQAAFAGVLVQQLTGEMWYGLAAALLMVILQIILADVFAAPVARLTGAAHLTYTQSFAVGAAPLAWLVNFIISKIPGLRDRRFSLEQSRRGNFLMEPSLWGLIAGIIMGLVAGLTIYDAVSFALVLAGCLFALPRLLRVFCRAASSVLEPMATRKVQSGKLPLMVAVNAVTGTANATTLLSAVVLVPVTVLLASVLPGNLVLPLGDCAMLLYLMIFVTALSGGCLLRSLFTGAVSAVAMLYCGTLLTYLFTNAARAMDAAAYSAGQYNTLCNTANPLSLLFVEGASYGIAGIAALAVLVLGIAFLAGRRLRRLTLHLATSSTAAAETEAPAAEEN